MSATCALGRLFWRPATLWSVLVISGMVFGLLLVHGAIMTSLPWLVPSQDAFDVRSFHALGLVLVPLFSGMLVSDNLRSLEHCPFSFTLPGSRSGFARGSAVCAAMIALLCGATAGDAPAAILVVACTSAFWFALGLLLFDPGLPRWGTFAGLFLALAGFLYAEWYAWWLEGPLGWRAPGVISAIVLAGAFAGFRLRFDDRSARAGAELGPAAGNAAGGAQCDLLATRDGAAAGRPSMARRDDRRRSSSVGAGRAVRGVWSATRRLVGGALPSGASSLPLAS